MGRRYWGTLNFLKPEWREDVENLGQFVVDNYRDGPSDLRVAGELLVLAGSSDSASRLNDLLSAVYARDQSVLNNNELDQVIDILGSVEAAVSTTLLDAEDHVPLAKIDALRAQSTLIDFSTDVGHFPEDGVAEALSRVLGVRDALVKARDGGLNVSLN